MEGFGDKSVVVVESWFKEISRWRRTSCGGLGSL